MGDSNFIKQGQSPKHSRHRSRGRSKPRVSTDLSGRSLTNQLMEKRSDSLLSDYEQQDPLKPLSQAQSGKAGSGRKKMAKRRDAWGQEEEVQRGSRHPSRSSKGLGSQEGQQFDGNYYNVTSGSKIEVIEDSSRGHDGQMAGSDLEERGRQVSSI